jgi:NADPH:quinone reductase-like Zn-dependent oxidoreductase
VLIRVTAFGLNRSELHTRLGLADGATFLWVPGIEATGVVAACPNGEYAPGQQVTAMMGGMRRTFDGGYADICVCVESNACAVGAIRWGRRRAPGRAHPAVRGRTL